VADDLIRAAAKVRFSASPSRRMRASVPRNDEVFRRAEEALPRGWWSSPAIRRPARAGWQDLVRSARRSLMFSILLHPAIPLPSYPLLSLTLAASVAATASIVGSGITVKWPNDVLQRGKKFCGILAESRVLRPGDRPCSFSVRRRQRGLPRGGLPPGVPGDRHVPYEARRGAFGSVVAFFPILQHFAHER